MRRVMKRQDVGGCRTQGQGEIKPTAKERSERGRDIVRQNTGSMLQCQEKANLWLPVQRTNISCD